MRHRYYGNKVKQEQQQENKKTKKDDEKIQRHENRMTTKEYVIKTFPKRNAPMDSHSHQIGNEYVSKEITNSKPNKRSYFGNQHMIGFNNPINDKIASPEEEELMIEGSHGGVINLGQQINQAPKVHQTRNFNDNNEDKENNPKSKTFSLAGAPPQAEIQNQNKIKANGGEEIDPRLSGKASDRNNDEIIGFNNIISKEDDYTQINICKEIEDEENQNKGKQASNDLERMEYILRAKNNPNNKPENIKKLMERYNNIYSSGKGEDGNLISNSQAIIGSKNGQLFDSGRRPKMTRLSNLLMKNQEAPSEFTVKTLKKK